MSISSQIFSFAVTTLDRFGYTGIFVLMAMESATLPIPSEVVLPLAGYLVYLGGLDFWAVVFVASLGSMIGTLTDYWIGLYLGRSVILRYGRYIRLNESHLARSEDWFNRFGEVTVLLARFVPLIRTLVAFPAGIAEMKLWKFVAFSAVGILIWNALLIYIGLVAGRSSSEIVSVLSSDFTVVEVIALVVAVVAISAYLLHGRRGGKTAGNTPMMKEEQKGTELERK